MNESNPSISRHDFPIFFRAGMREKASTIDNSSEIVLTPMHRFDGRLLLEHCNQDQTPCRKRRKEKAKQNGFDFLTYLNTTQ
jgi:hypothetical protein